MEKEKTYHINDLVEVNTGSVVSKQLMKTKGGNVTCFAFDKGEGLSEHTAPFDAMVQVIEGAVDIKIGGVTHLVSAGEVIIMPANVPHALHAVEPFKMMLVMLKEG